MDEIEFDPIKRRLTLEHRGLDMARAVEAFDGPTMTLADERRAYGENRYLTVGYLDGRMVVVIWTPRGAARRIISLRKANEREQAKYQSRMG